MSRRVLRSSIARRAVQGDGNADEGSDASAPTSHRSPGSPSEVLTVTAVLLANSMLIL
jgi:hypothetical protein